MWWPMLGADLLEVSRDSDSVVLMKARVGEFTSLLSPHHKLGGLNHRNLLFHGFES